MCLNENLILYHIEILPIADFVYKEIPYKSLCEGYAGKAGSSLLAVSDV